MQTHKISTKLAIVALSCAVIPMLTSCKKGNSYRVPYNTVCEVHEIGVEEVAKSCRDGERILFSLDYLDEQLPLMFAALHCNPEYAIVANKAGVSCVYQGVNQEDFKKRAAALESKKQEIQKKSGQ